ncbi:MAG: hypothetical protein AAF519_00590 [Bacteroidota bacterium]
MKLTACILILLLVNGCSKKTDEFGWDAYTSWLAEESNGLYKMKQSKNINITATFQPSDFIIYKSLDPDQGYHLQSVDSLRTSLHGSLNFQITISAKNPDVNLLWWGVGSYPDYKQRVNQLSFNAGQMLRLVIDDQESQVLLTHFEGYNELSDKIILHVAFENKNGGLLDSQSKIKLTFEDPFWGSGVNHFTYKMEDITNVPKLTFS